MNIHDKNDTYKLDEIIENLEFHIDNQMIIKVERKNIDEHEYLMGFPLKLSKNLLLMSQVIDFRDNGCLIIRLKDITDAYSLESDGFYEEMCVKEGLRDKAIDNDVLNDVDSWISVLKQLVNYEGYVSVQCELEDNELYYSIGRICKLEEKGVYFHYFDLDGEWEKEPRIIPIDKITMVNFGDNYSNTYYKYMR